MYINFDICSLPQRRYIIKFATDGAVLTNTKNAVQGTIKIIPATVDGKVLIDHDLPTYLDKEFTVYYYIGILIKAFIIQSKKNHIIPNLYFESTSVQLWSQKF